MRHTATRVDRSQIENRLVWLMVLRVVVVTLLLGSAVTVEAIKPSEAQVNPLYFLIALTYLLTLLYALVWPLTESKRREMAHVQIFADLLIITGVVYATGGIETNFSLLYFISIISASIILYRFGGLVAATTASLCYGTALLLVYFGVVSKYSPAQARVLLSAEVLYYSIFFHGFGFFTVALLTSYLSEGLRRTGKELEEASGTLADLQAFNQTVIDSISSGLMSTDLEGRINFFNAAAEVILGVRTSEAIGRKVHEILGEGEDYLEHVQSMLEHRRYSRVDKAYRNGRGQLAHLGLSVSYLVSQGEKRSGFLFTFQDLTEIKRLEREVRLKENLATVGEVAAGMAHEIRNPLASISGSVQVLRETLGLEGENSRLMDIIVRESERLSGILKDFLVYARPTRFQPEDIDLREVIEETATLLRNSSEVQPDHEIVLNLPSQPVILFADANQMKQIAWNLSRNAIQAMPGGGRLEVELQSNDRGQVVMAFRDEGVGLREDDLREHFLPFKSGFKHGSGLGLAIVYRMVQDYGGVVRVQPRSPRGTEVSVHFSTDGGAIG